MKIIDNQLVSQKIAFKLQVAKFPQTGCMLFYDENGKVFPSAFASAEIFAAHTVNSLFHHLPDPKGDGLMFLLFISRNPKKGRYCCRLVSDKAFESDNAADALAMAILHAYRKYGQFWK